MLKKNIDSLVAAAAGFFIIFLFTRHSGIGLCPDGVAFSSGAKCLDATGNLYDFTQTPLINFPVGYPLFLYGIMKVTGVSIMGFAPYLNALLFGVLIFLAGWMMEYFRYPSKWYKAAILSCIVLSPALLEDYSMLWSETLFVIWILLFMILARQYLLTGSRKMLVAAAGIAAIACITRYAGITLLGLGGLLILLDRGVELKKKIINLLLFGCIGSSLLIGNLVRNYLLSGTLTGDREQSITSLGQNTHDAGAVFASWLPFAGRFPNLEAVLTVLMVAALAFSCFRFLYRRRPENSFEYIATVFSLLYLLFMIVTASISRFEQLNSRFMSPAYIPLLWSGTNWILSAYRHAHRVKRYGLIAMGSLLFMGFQYHQLNVDAETWDGVKDAGIPGYTEDQWTKSATVDYITKDSLHFKKGYTIYSDAYDAIYYFTGRRGEFLPHKESASEKQEFLNDPHCYVIWFTDGDNEDLVDTNYVKAVKGLEVVKRFDDGVILASK